MTWDTVCTSKLYNSNVQYNMNCINLILL